MPPLTRADAERIAVKWFLTALDSAEDFRSALPAHALERRIEDAEWGAAEARRALVEGGLADKERLARCLRDAAGLGSEPVADAALVRLLGRAAVALHEVEAGRLLARYETRPTDPLFAAAMEAPRRAAPSHARRPAQPQEASEKTIGDLERDYRAARLSGLSPATVQGYEPVFRLLRDVLGSGAALAKLTHDEGQALFDAVRALPANAQKLSALAGLPVPEAIREGKRRGLPTITPKTINDRYMANLGALFRFAQQRGWMDRNPVAGLRARELVAAADAREPFGPRLIKLFGSAPWTPQDRAGEGRAIRYWGPLLALYHGLRLGEVAGLQVRDISEEHDTPLLVVQSGTRQLKTEAAKRTIPLHPELIRLGFLGFLEARRAEALATDMLFAGERAYARDQWGRLLGDWFARRVRWLGLEGRKLTFHSLRHDFRDALREAEVEKGLADYLMGHSQAGVGATYGAGRPSLARLQTAIRAVQYANLKLPAPQNGLKS